jgi:hypothetical protein
LHVQTANIAAAGAFHSIRAFLGYDLTQDTPDHTTLSVIRSRLGVEV